MNQIKFIQWIFAILFSIITISAFALSYVNLVAAAVSAGILPTLAPLWPLCLDSFMIMSSLFILMANLNHESSWQGWIVLLCFTLVSTGFNVAHSPSDLLSQSAHALPPVALCIGLELLMIRIKRDLLSAECGPIVLTQDEIILPDKHRKVLLWFRGHETGTLEQARKDLGMGFETVRKIRDELVHSGLLSDTLLSECPE